MGDHGGASEDATEAFCRRSLALALGRPVPNASVYWGSSRRFDEALARARATLNGKSEASNAVFTLLYSLLADISHDEEWSAPDNVEAVRSLIDELFEGSKAAALSYYLMPQFYATRVLSRLNYGSLDLPGPSINVGIGEGVTSAYVFGNRVLDVGADLAAHDVIEAARRGGCRQYFAFDAMDAPFADGAFASAVSMNTVYHADDKRRTVAELARIIRPGGSLFFDDLQKSFLARPIPSLLNAAGFTSSSASALASHLKPQPFYTKAEYEQLLRELGFATIEVRPMMSAPLFRLIYFFYDLERFLGAGISDAHEGALRRFLHVALAPLLADDRRLSERYGGAYWFVAARKSGDASGQGIVVRCPACHAVITPPYACGCGSKYPIVNGIPLLSKTYARLWTTG
jgi:SAM-dependent methyltransferase